MMENYYDFIYMSMRLIFLYIVDTLTSNLHIYLSLVKKLDCRGQHTPNDCQILGRMKVAT